MTKDESESNVIDITTRRKISHPSELNNPSIDNEEEKKLISDKIKLANFLDGEGDLPA